MTLPNQQAVVACWRHKTEGLRKVVKKNRELYRLAAVSFDRFDLGDPRETEHEKSCRLQIN